LAAKLSSDMPKVQHIEPYLTLKGILMLAKKHFKS